jgi:hypothetical protein
VLQVHVSVTQKTFILGFFLDCVTEHSRPQKKMCYTFLSAILREYSKEQKPKQRDIKIISVLQFLPPKNVTRMFHVKVTNIVVFVLIVFSLYSKSNKHMVKEHIYLLLPILLTGMCESMCVSDNLKEIENAIDAIDASIHFLSATMLLKRHYTEGNFFEATDYLLSCIQDNLKAVKNMLETIYQKLNPHGDVENGKVQNA